jgi:hypothetical protein
MRRLPAITILHRVRFNHPRLVVAMLLVAACGDTTGPGKARVGTVVELPASVDAATRAHITKFVTTAGTASATGGARVAVADTGRTPVLAVNAGGKAVLAAFVAAGTTPSLDARSSALFLARVIADEDAIVAGEASALEALVAAQPGFAALVDSVGARASRGLPLFGTEATVMQAVAVAAGLPRRTAPAPLAVPAIASSAIGAETSRARFTSYSYVIPSYGSAAPLTGGGRITLTNGLLVPLRFTTPDGELKIDAAEFCVACWAIARFTPSTASFVVQQDGAFSLTADLDRERVIVQGVLDIAGVVFMKLTDAIPDKEKAAKLMVGFLGTSVDAVGVRLQGKSGTEAAAVMWDWIRSEAVEEAFLETGKALLPSMDAVSTSMVLGNIVDALNIVGTAGGFGKAMASYSLAWHYWDRPREDAYWCIEESKLYGGCSDRITIAPSWVELEPGAGAQMFATVLDMNGRVLEGRAVTWSTNNASVATVAADGAILAKALGNAEISARAGTVVGKASVTVDVDSVAFYKNAILGFWTVTNGTQPKPYRLEILEGGRGIYHVEEAPGTMPGKYGMSWVLGRNSSGRYYFTDIGFWNGWSPQSLLTTPLSAFSATSLGTTVSYTR